MGSQMHQSMCWLCGQESDIFRFRHSTNPRAALYRFITLAHEGNASASISGIHSRPVSPLPRMTKQNGRYTPRKSCYDTNTSPIYNGTTHTWTFRVHFDCWEMISSRVSDPIVLATNWSKTLITLNWKATPLGFLRTYSDIPSFAFSPLSSPHKKRQTYRRLSLETLDSFEGLETELGLSQLPTNNSPIPLDKLGVLNNNPNQHRQISYCSSTSMKRSDAFLGLPQELQQHIIHFLPTTDLLNLRLASRPMARVSTLEALPRSFWFSRFTPAFEVGFALPARFDADLDWRGLYFLIRGACNEGSALIAPAKRKHSLIARLIKRKYWWERLGGVVELCGSQNAGQTGVVGDNIPDILYQPPSSEMFRTSETIRRT
ncbi:hypothetical protein QBC43DRAFT_71192 [Cladorrhinum sp. PSN259]|nr:hypothetical protein QBC43DRAFT_71192 [Cladorrhinum sp. PSN259]